MVKTETEKFQEKKDLIKKMKRKREEFLLEQDKFLAENY